MPSFSNHPSPLPTMLTVLVATLILLAGMIEVQANEASDLHDLWAMQDPQVTLIDSSSTIIVDYSISAQLSPQDNVRTIIYANPECVGPALTEGILLDDVHSATGAHVFRVDVQTLIHNEMISTIDYENELASMHLCLYYSLWSGPEENAIEVNSIYNNLYIYLSMSGEVKIDGFLVTENPDDDEYNNGDRHKHHESEKHWLDVYLCNHKTLERMSAPVGGYGMGDVLSICAAASQSIIDDGIYLLGVDNFMWRRTVKRGRFEYVTEQWAVKDGVPDGVSSYHCPHAALLCTFTTMLQAEFFMQEGYVEGKGSAALKFGVRRNLEDGTVEETMGLPVPSKDVHILFSTDDSRSLKEIPQDDDNMSILIPIRGPGERPSLKSQERTGSSKRTLYMIFSSLVCVIGLASLVAWREYQLGKVGEHEKKALTRNEFL